MRKFVYEKLFRHEEGDWWNRGLRTIVMNYIKRFSPRASGRLLDVGCGSGYFLTQLRSNWRVSGIDVSPQAIRMAKSRSLKRIKLASVDKIPFPENSFDVVLVLDVLEHVKNEMRGLSEIKRVLKPGGIAVLNSPAFVFLWSHHDESAGHLRRYTKNEFAGKLRRAGFAILKITYVNFFLFPLALIYRLSAKIFFSHGRKTDVGSVPAILQPLFYAIFSSEAILLGFVNFPFGLSVSAVVTKPKTIASVRRRLTTGS